MKSKFDTSGVCTIYQKELSLDDILVKYDNKRINSNVKTTITKITKNTILDDDYEVNLNYVVNIHLNDKEIEGNFLINIIDQYYSNNKKTSKYNISDTNNIFYKTDSSELIPLGGGLFTYKKIVPNKVLAKIIPEVLFKYIEYVKVEMNKNNRLTSNFIRKDYLILINSLEQYLYKKYPDVFHKNNEKKKIKAIIKLSPIDTILSNINNRIKEKYFDFHKIQRDNELDIKFNDLDSDSKYEIVSILYDSIDTLKDRTKYVELFNGFIERQGIKGKDLIKYINLIEEKEKNKIFKSDAMAINDILEKLRTLEFIKTHIEKRY